MQVTIEFSGQKNEPGDEYEAWCDVRIDGKIIARASNFSGCPEDANLGRGLRFVYGLPEALKGAYEAGQRGEGFAVDEVENAGE